MTLGFLQSTQNISSRSFFRAKTAGEAHSVCAGSIAFIGSMSSIQNLSKRHTLDTARYGTKCIGSISGESRSTPSLTVEI